MGVQRISIGLDLRESQINSTAGFQIGETDC